jgi:hypothetical protein
MPFAGIFLEGLSQYPTYGSGSKIYRKKKQNAIQFKGTPNNTKKYGAEIKKRVALIMQIIAIN